jgi:hypothetical protein
MIFAAGHTRCARFFDGWSRAPRGGWRGFIPFPRHSPRTNRVGRRGFLPKNGFGGIDARNEAVETTGGRQTRDGFAPHLSWIAFRSYRLPDRSA